jgi:hypothetical protein
MPDSLHIAAYSTLFASPPEHFDSLFVKIQLDNLIALQSIHENRIQQTRQGLLGRYAENWLPEIKAILSRDLFSSNIVL